MVASALDSRDEHKCGPVEHGLLHDRRHRADGERDGPLGRRGSTSRSARAAAQNGTRRVHHCPQFRRAAALVHAVFTMGAMCGKEMPVVETANPPGAPSATSSTTEVGQIDLDVSGSQGMETEGFRDEQPRASLIGDRGRPRLATEGVLDWQPRASLIGDRGRLHW